MKLRNWHEFTRKLNNSHKHYIMYPFEIKLIKVKFICTIYTTCAWQLNEWLSEKKYIYRRSRYTSVLFEFFIFHFLYRWTISNLIYSLKYTAYTCFFVIISLTFRCRVYNEKQYVSDERYNNNYNMVVANKNKSRFQTSFL